VTRTILSLCDYSGVWPEPYAKAGYRVVTVDLQHGQDVRKLEHPGEVHGILAAPPCTLFSFAGNRWKRTEAQMLEALAVVDACLRFVASCRPKWWALENPVGKLARWLGPPTLVFHPNEYGDPWTKRTALWGAFRPPEKRPVPASLGSRIHLLTGADRHDSQERATRLRNARSETPKGFARAFYEANP
jgi:hypothetical protein